MADPGVAAAAALSRHDNASVWFNLSNWTVQHMPYLNMTKLAPSIEDLVLAGPRIVMKLSRLGSVFSFPDAVDGFGQRHLPDATPDSTIVFAATTDPVAAARSFITTAPPAAAQSLTAAQDAAASRFSFESARSFGSVFSYATSKWALCCMAMAVVLNRTHIFAATRRRLRLRWPVRLALRIVPIILFTFQAQSLVQSIQCQTSPDFAELRWGNASKSSDLMFSHANSFLHGLSSALLLGDSDVDSCLAVHMIPPLPSASEGAEQAQPDLRGSLSLLWPLFGSFCLSQFLETISCAVQGRPLAAETGMTLFEHSLAFAEADAAISNQLGWGLFTASASTAAGAAKAAASMGSAATGANIAITRSMIMKRANTPPEVLLVAFLSAMGHVTSHILAVFNLQSKFRLVSTGFYAACFMGSIIWSGFTFSLDDPARQGLLRFPTVCIIGYIPHLLVLFGMLTCCSIYSLSLLLSALSPPEVGTSPDNEGEDLSTLGARLRRAHDNMQANISLSDVRITMEMDFYTALLRAGFAAISMASEAVYLNEDRRVNLKRYTWLEDERLREIEQLRMQWLPNSRYDSNGAIGLVPVVHAQTGRTEGAGGYATTGYARERAAQKVAKTRGSERVRPMRDGVGAHERSGRWLLALEYIMHINRLMLRVLAMAMCKALARLGFANPPRFLRYLAQEPKPRGAPEVMDMSTMDSTDAGVGAKVDGVRDGRGRIVGEWMRGQETRAYVPWKSGVDLEEIVTKQFPEEQDTSGFLYKWWLRGGWWGEVDRSGDYRPPSDDGDPDFDATSVVSTTETESQSEVGRWDSDDNEQDWEDEDDGQRTPTRRSPFATRESTPMVDSPMAMADLARLLHPQSPEERDEALALAAHLGSDGIMTRSRFARLSAQRRARVLMPAGASSAVDLAGRVRHPHQPRRSHKMSPDEEAQLLEQILLSRRAQAAGEGSSSSPSSSSPSSSWATGAAGMGPEGPQCVVCHSSSRTIIVWPCRCLSLCDDCRVSLAMNNFDKCVCCRREVISFSRIFVP
ncbi:hypothetical protein RB600_010098 [Gaeumannomyces tritici]